MIPHDIPDMTLRDYFAAEALGGLIEWKRLRGKEDMFVSGEFTDVNDQPLLPELPYECADLVEAAYVIADAMMINRKERDQYETWDGKDD
jgi:hypothetical protein